MKSLKLLLLVSVSFVQAPLLAAVDSGKSKTAAIGKKPAEAKKPKWLLKNFGEMVHQDPARVLKMGNELFSQSRLRITSVEPGLAHEWQHRLAMVTALSEFFNPSLKAKTSNYAVHRLKARAIIERALKEDPSLLVRDGAVESLRRIFQMQPGEAKLWKEKLESAFMSPKNVMDGEGFFIRETILTAMQEGGLGYSKTIRAAAKKDKNAEVRNLINSKSKVNREQASTWQFTGQAKSR